MQHRLYMLIGTIKLCVKCKRLKRVGELKVVHNFYLQLVFYFSDLK